MGACVGVRVCLCVRIVGALMCVCVSVPGGLCVLRPFSLLSPLSNCVSYAPYH